MRRPILSLLFALGGFILGVIARPPGSSVIGEGLGGAYALWSCFYGFVLIQIISRKLGFNIGPGWFLSDREKEYGLYETTDFSGKKAYRIRETPESQALSIIITIFKVIGGFFVCAIIGGLGGALFMLGWDLYNFLKNLRLCKEQ